MQRGQRVQVTEAFTGQQVKRVVSADDKFVFVCREEEFIQAQRENREPAHIGFAREFVRELPNES